MNRTRYISRARYLLPLAALALLGSALIACGDDDDGDDNGGGNTTPTTAAQSSPTTAAQATPTTGGSGGDEVVIRVEDIVFVPDERTVPVGTEVTWRWAGELPHSVEGTFNGEDVESEQQVSGEFSFTFESAGTFEYICGVHGQAMSGRIVVQ